jgi:hypothetical protein
MGRFQSWRRPAEAHLVIASDNYGENISSRLGAERTTRPRARRLQGADRGDRWKHPDHRRYRIRESLPTIELLRAKDAKVILLAHFGHPKDKPNLKYSLRPVADHLTQMISPPVHFSPEVIGPSVEAVSKALPDGGVLQGENVQFL